MQYQFDEIIDRHNTNSVKYDLSQPLFGTKEITPMWVADLDFRTPDFIVEAIKKRCEHPIFGYTLMPDSLTESFCQWTKRRHHWEIKPEWTDFVPGIVTGIDLAIQTFTKPGDKIIVQPPVYPPFFNAPALNGRQVVWNPLQTVNGHFEMDLEHLASQMDEQTTMLILSNPHNPGGRVWERQTLASLAELCQQKGILVVSDEIHADMTFSHYHHIPFASVSEKAASNSVTFMSPSKAFNIPGLIGSFAIIPDEQLYRRLHKTITQFDLHGNLFAYEAMEAAFNQGDEWLDQMLRYVEINAADVVSFFETEVPLVSAMKPEASFLVWIDFSKLSLSDSDLRRCLVEKAKVGMNEGHTFGPGGTGHQRMNVGAPRSVVLNALERIGNALKELG
ncbi:MAG: MalY/PatB family protein [Microbacter sp.]